jgi:hypothetical protein
LGAGVAGRVAGGFSARGASGVRTTCTFCFRNDGGALAIGVIRRAGAVRRANGGGTGAAAGFFAASCPSVALGFFLAIRLDLLAQNLTILLR